MTRVSPDEEKLSGRVFLVGAGPGDPSLITLRGLQCLNQADCVLFDGLVNLSLLDYAPGAQKISVGKHGKIPIWQQSEINLEMIRLAREGKTVVRLKGGDPAVFGRTAEELEALSDNGIPFEVVPGITAALAVSAYCGIPLTHREHASAVALITGQQQADAPEDMDWGALAAFPGTLSIYMGVTTSRTWTSKLMAAGKPADTPAAIVRRCSWSDQQVILCRLDEVAEQLTPYSRLRPPVLVVVGPVAHLGQCWNWFQQRPLFGCGIWIPRASHQSEQLRADLIELGAAVVAEPVVQIEPPSDLSELARAEVLLRGQCLQGVTFSSANGVDGLMSYLLANDNDVRILAGVRLAAVGPATAQQLKRYGLKADIVPKSDFSAEGLLASVGENLQGEHWLITTTNRSRTTLVDHLRSRGAMVTSCLTYQTTPCAQPGIHLQHALENRQVDLALITSSALGELAFELLGDQAAYVSPVALSPSIAQSLESLGWPPLAVAQANTTDSLIKAVLQAAGQGSTKRGHRPA